LDEFIVVIDDLSKGSKNKVIIQCDNCNKEFKTIFKNYNKSKYGDFCTECKPTNNKSNEIKVYKNHYLLIQLILFTMTMKMGWVFIK
jgi:DNA replicative helicase MCM subunit Mcm2 (Cdc46/Mcm family)